MHKNARNLNYLSYDMNILVHLSCGGEPRHRCSSCISCDCSVTLQNDLCAFFMHGPRVSHLLGNMVKEYLLKSFT